MVKFSKRKMVKTTKRKPRSKNTYPRKTNLLKLIKSVSLKQAETKNTHIIQEDQQLYHNGEDIKKGMLNTTASINDGQGGTANTACRLGDQVIAKGISLKIWLANKLDRPNVMYRIVIFKYNSNENPMGIYYSQGSTNIMLRDLNTEKYTILRSYSTNLQVGYSAALTTIPSAVGKEAHKLLKFWIPLKMQKLQYQDNTDVPKNKNIGFCVSCYDSSGTLITDNIASYSYNYKFYFKDP